MFGRGTVPVSHGAGRRVGVIYMSPRGQIRVAQLDGHARYCVNHRTPETESIADLHQITDRLDLLAQAAGIIIGATNQRLRDWPQRRAYARLLIVAGRTAASSRTGSLRAARTPCAATELQRDVAR